MKVASKRKKIQHAVVDLFAGCGGLSLGLELAGFHPVFVNELNKDALESYLRNRDDIEPRLRDQRFHCNNIKDLVREDRMRKLKQDLEEEFGVNVDNGDLDLVVGGPPCQGFSGIGHRRSYSVDKEQLPSNQLFQDMAWVVSQLRPKAFLFENVKGLMSAKWNKSGKKGEIWEEVQEAFRSIPGYRVEPDLILAKDYGVPQNRPRVLLVGVREGIDVGPWMKKNSGVAKGFLPPKGGTPPDLADLLGDLKDDGYLKNGDTTHYLSAATGVQEWYRKARKGAKIAQEGDPLTEQEYSVHSKRIVEKFQYMVKHDGKIPKRFQTKKFAQRLLPAQWTATGPTITATSLPDDYVHYELPRILTVREWARLQGFPDWYQFSGSRTTGGLRRAGNPRAGLFDRELPKYTQIGNAVPVRLAEAVGRHLMKILKE